MDAFIAMATAIQQLVRPRSRQTGIGSWLQNRARQRNTHTTQGVTDKLRRIQDCLVPRAHSVVLQVYRGTFQLLLVLLDSIFVANMIDEIVNPSSFQEKQNLVVYLSARV